MASKNSNDVGEKSGFIPSWKAYSLYSFDLLGLLAKIRFSTPHFGDGEIKIIFSETPFPFFELTVKWFGQNVWLNWESENRKPIQSIPPEMSQQKLSVWKMWINWPLKSVHLSDFLMQAVFSYYPDVFWWYACMPAFSHFYAISSAQ